MLNRRRLVTGALAAATTLIGYGNRMRVSATEFLLQGQTTETGERPGTPYPLVALPGKAPMGQVYDLPPNYETPMHHLIGEKNYPLTDNEYYYVRYREGVPPKFKEGEYRLKITGDCVTNELELTLDELMNDYDRQSIACVGECSGQGRGILRPVVPGMPWTKGDMSAAEWTGVPLKQLLDKAGVDREKAKWVHFIASGSTIATKKGAYIRTLLPEAVLDNEEIILAYKMGGEDLPYWNGYPLRLVAPGVGAPRWVKQLTEIRVSTTEEATEWSQREITKGSLKTKSMITNPPDGTEVPIGKKVKLTGVAWDKGVGTAKVELSADGGKTWWEAELEERKHSKYVWTVFTSDYVVDRYGPIKIMSRATDNEGETQPVEEPQATWDNGGRNCIGCDTFQAILVGK